MINTLASTNATYIVGLYIRLSKDDGKLGESESITNQKSFLTDYAIEHGYIIHDTYIDDGFSGTNFNRPAFKRMIRDIEDGKINMVITKDLSRLGRDYIGTGEYIERYFPSHNVRYFAITDNIDTMQAQSNLDMAPFKAVFNDMYAKDISKKIRTALHTKQKEGKWVGGCTPLGYMKDPNDKNHLVINEDEAWVVRKIFDLALKGKGTVQIKDALYEEKIPTAYQLRNSKNFYGESSARGIWSAKTIKGILTNRLYTGDMVQNRRSRINYKVRKIVDNDESNWYIVENTHEGLIDKESFNLVGNMLKKTNQKNTKKEIRLLDGLLLCHECGHKLGICAPRKSDGRTYTVCNYYRQHSKLHLCTSHGFSYEKLEETVINSIKEICFKTLNKEQLKKSETNITLDSPKDNLIKEKNNIENEINNITRKLDNMYLDKLDGKVSDDMYGRLSEKLNSDIKSLKEKLEKINSSLESIKDSFDIGKECDRLINEFIGFKNPTRDIMLKLIDRIEVHKNKQLDIYFNFAELNFF